MTNLTFTKVVLLVAGVVAGGEPSAWSRVGGSLEYRWSRPAQNSCQVEIRTTNPADDLVISLQTSYLPHAALKSSAKQMRQTAHFSNAGSLVQSIAECEKVTGVSVSAVEKHDISKP